jgi:hypothetical protein
MEQGVSAAVLSERLDTTGGKRLADARAPGLWDHVDSPEVAVPADFGHEQIGVEASETLTGGPTYIGAVLNREEHTQAMATLALLDESNDACLGVFDNVGFRHSNIEPHLAKHLG